MSYASRPGRTTCISTMRRTSRVRRSTGPAALTSRAPRWTRRSAPQSRREHSACGVGLVARISGEPSREVVELALGALAAMEHRGGVGADGEASDGAGVLTAIPWRVLEPWLAEQRVAEPRPFSTAVGMVFLPREQGKRNLARELVAKALRDEGLVVVGWRSVPLRPQALPPSVRERHPHVEQVVAHVSDAGRRRPGARAAAGPQGAWVARSSASPSSAVWTTSTSARSRRGPSSTRAWSPRRCCRSSIRDLQDPAFVSPYAVLHRRFSTNTAPKWSLAQPMRLLAHNGEINTLLGNLALDARPGAGAGGSGVGRADRRAAARRARRQQRLRRARQAGRVAGAQRPQPARGADDDNAGRLRARGRRRGGGEAGAGDPRVTDFYDYYAGVQEAWDGPALVAFADGRHLGACVDRNGLRPARYALTRSGLLALASEAGAVDLSGEEIVEKGRLGPGQMIAVDLEHGRLLRDDVVKTSVASRRPYGAWLLAQRRTLAAQPFDVAVEAGAPIGAGFTGAAAAGSAGAAVPGPCGPGGLLRRQAAAGFTAEDVELIVRPMARQAREPRFSMGNDAPLPILSGKPHVLYDYFTERFAQVTNPRHRPAARAPRHVAGRQARPARRPAHRRAGTRPSGRAALAGRQQGGAGGAAGAAGCARPGSRPRTRSRADRGACGRPSSASAARPPPPCATARRSSSSATESRR